MSRLLKKTALHPKIEKESGKFVDFAGWEMPVQFPAGIIEEHKAVRQKAGLFDVSHMGKLLIEGKAGLPYLERLTVNNVKGMEAGQAQYTAMCNERGCPLDDMIVYKINEDSYRLVVNAANFNKILAHMHAHQPKEVDIVDATESHSLIALQGPNASKILGQLNPSVCDELRYYHFCISKLAGAESMIARLGYTGEDGFEIMCPNEHARDLWDLLMDSGKNLGLQPCGLGCRDTLRLEACFPLYGQELDEEHNLYESKLGWVVKLDKGDFIGREALTEQKNNPLAQKLIAFKQEKGIPRKGYEILNALGNPLGKVTSGSFSPILNIGIGLGFVTNEGQKAGDKILIRKGKKDFEATVTRPPFYKK